MLNPAYRYWRQSGAKADLALAWARADIAANRTRYPRSSGVSEGWQPASPSASRWVESLPAAGLRIVGYADAIASLRHTGWHTDDDGSNGETLRGVVLQLPARHGAPLYLAAYEDPNIPGAYAIDLGATYPGERGGDSEYDSGAREAARAADAFAERAAETQRDYARAWQEGVEHYSLGEEVAATRRDLLAILGERRRLDAIEAPAIRAAVCALIRSRLATIAEARREQAQLADRWRSPDERAAFSDGAQL